jgi:hypothetical protein
LPQLYIHDGACIAMRADVLDESHNRLDDNFAIFGGDRRAVIQERHATIEIDSPYDLLLAQAIITRGGFDLAKP